MYQVLGWIFFGLTLSVAGFIVYLFIHTVKVEKEIISKKNLFYLAPSFAILYLLHIVASVYIGRNMSFFYCVSLVKTTLDAFVFNPNIQLLEPISTAYPIFYADFIIATIVAISTVVLSVLSFFSSRIKNFVQKERRLRRGCDVVIGDSETALKYADKNPNCVLLCNVNQKRYAELLKVGAVVVRGKLVSRRICGKIKKRCHIIAFCDAKNSYSELIDAFAEIALKNDDVWLHLETPANEIKLIKDQFISKKEKSVSARITCFNKYELIARKFITDYPISKFLPNDFYNENRSVKCEKDINVVFIGFGKVNYRLFCLASMEFQFAQEKNGKLESKPVHYYVYDNDRAVMHNEFFSLLTYEFEKDFADADFPCPEKICDLKQPRNVDIHSTEARSEFAGMVSENTFTYFIISLDDDLEDAAYAQTLLRMFKENDNIKIFVRARNSAKENLEQRNNRVIYFGNDETIYSHSNVVNDDLTEFSQRINILYNCIGETENWQKEIEGLSPENKADYISRKFATEEVRRLKYEKWGELNLTEQFSNLYHALNIPFKLGLLGLEMSKRDGSDGISEDEYSKICNNVALKENFSDYSLYFETNTSNVIAYCEHSRWNAFYIYSDFTQMSKEEMLAKKVIKNGNIVSVPHKDVSRKKHACLTSYNGLNDLVMFKYSVMYPDADTEREDFNKDEQLRELGKVYAYDYMSIDSLYEELSALGYIIKRAKK